VTPLRNFRLGSTRYKNAAFVFEFQGSNKTAKHSFLTIVHYFKNDYSSFMNLDFSIRCRKKYAGRLSATLLVLMLFSVPQINAAEVACRTLTLAYYELGALYYRLPSGDYTGIDKDVINEIEKRTSCQFQTSLESRVRIWSQLSQHSLDMSVSGISTPEREEFARFIPYFSIRNYLLLRDDVPLPARSLEGFLANPNLLVGVVKSFKHGATYDAWLERMRAQKRVHEAADFDTLMRLFSGGRVQAVLALPTSFQPRLHQDKLVASTIIIDLAPSDRIQHGLIISKSRVDQETFEILQKAIHAMQEDGSLERIFKQHVGDKLAKEMRLEKSKR
jgi:polar amino acid transport system substrate-binding protein